jgi:hypothetical protein
MKSVRYFVTLLFTGMAYAATPITTCQTIATPGNYFLDADIVATAACITINASNVSLALNNHSITGAGSGIGITVTPAVSGRLDHIGISGPGSIKGFATGITINNVDYVQVSQLVSFGHVSNGINSGGTNTFVTIASNIFTQNGVWGILVTADNSSVTGNELAGNGFGTGIHPAGGMKLTGTNDTIANNLALGNGKNPDNTNTLNAGIVVNTIGSQITGNVADGNNGAGIEVQTTASTNQLFKNKALGNIGNDLQDDNAACDANSWVDNTFFTRNPASCVK